MAVIALPKTPNAATLKDLGRLQDIPAVRQLGAFAVVAAVIALGLWLFFWTQKPDYVPVFAGLDGKATTEAGDLLTNAQIPFRIEDGGALAVPADRLGEAKMALAAAGLPNQKAQGFDAMDGQQTFGTSQFMENARYQNALEQELARTIANLRPVREARVHLALPKPSAFTRQKESASASVVLQLQPGASLEQGQVDAIVHLVSSSITGLPPQNVTVVDQSGRMLSNPDPDSEAAIGAKQFDAQRRQEAVFVSRIQELLEPMTGRGRVSAQVTVDMDFSQTEEAREMYGAPPLPGQQPAGTQVRSEQVSESGTLGAAGGNAFAAATGVPGSTSNAPAAGTATPPAAAESGVSGPGSRTAVRNYEVDRTLTHRREAPGRIRRVTAAVLVDNIPVSNAGSDTKKTPVSYRALNATEVQRIESLVQQAVGFDANRGDVVSVVNAPFAPAAADLAEDALPLWQDPKMLMLARTVLGGLAVLALILFVLRPAFRNLMGGNKAAAAPAPQVVQVIDEDVQVNINSNNTIDARQQTAQVHAAPVANFDEKLQIARTAVGTDPKRVANVVRAMVEADG